MTPQDEPDVAAIVGRLSAAQRRALVDRQGSLGVCRALKRKGLADRTEGTGMAWLAFPVLTSLGWSVRAHLIDLAETGREKG